MLKSSVFPNQESSQESAQQSKTLLVFLSLFEGYLFKDNIAEAKKYFALASDLGCHLKYFLERAINYAGRDGGVEKDENKAIKIYQFLSEEKNDSLAQYNLGAMLYKYNKPESMKLMRLAAYNKCHEALFQLALYYKSGKCPYVEQNDTVAIFLFTLAQIQGNKKANEHLDAYLIGDEEKVFQILEEHNTFLFKTSSRTDQTKILTQKFATRFFQRLERESSTVKIHRKTHILIADEFASNFAKYFLGVQYMKGMGVAKDEKKGIELIMEAAAKEIVLAKIALAECYLHGNSLPKDEKQAFEILDSLVRRTGNKKAMVALSQYYVIVEKNYKKTFELLNEAHLKGEKDATFLLAAMYETGAGIEQNLSKAARSYAILAEQGHFLAQEKLACCYFFAKGVPKDALKAFKLFSLAADQGSIEAVRKMAGFYEVGEPGVVEKDERYAFKLYKIAAEQEEIMSYYKLAMCYYKGRGTDKNLSEAVRLLHIGVEKGCSWAQHALGGFYLEGIGVTQNKEEAIRLITLAADGGFEIAKQTLEAVTSGKRLVCM